jgi:L-fuculose-phosphate aldolase
VLKEFQLVGQDLFTAGINNSHSGNLSVRYADRIIITRRGSILGHLTQRDMIETGLEKNDSNITLASTEIRVHRAIYQQTSALAIVHSHPVFATALSLVDDEIIPIDSEGAYLLHKIPVLGAEHTVGSQEVEEKLPHLLKEYKIVMLRGHGSFAIGQLMEEAFQLTTSLEHSCKILYHTRLLRGDLKEDKTGKYKGW